MGAYRKDEYQTDPPTFLLDMLCTRPVSKQLIDKRATAHGFHRDQLYRAKRKLGVVAFKERGTMSGGWYWALPQHAPPERQVIPPTEPSPLNGAANYFQSRPSLPWPKSRT